MACHLINEPFIVSIFRNFSSLHPLREWFLRYLGHLRSFLGSFCDRVIFGSSGGYFWPETFGVNRVSKPKKRKLLLPHIPFAIALNTIGRETGDGIPGASTAKTTSLGIIRQSLF